MVIVDDGIFNVVDSGGEDADKTSIRDLDGKIYNIHNITNIIFVLSLANIILL